MFRSIRTATAVSALAITFGGTAAAAPPAAAHLRPAGVLSAAPSATVAEYTVHGDGVDLFVRAAGSPQARTTVIALSGGPGLSSEYMRPFEPMLASDQVRVVTWDQRGTGRSTKPADDDYSVAAYVADLEAVRRSLGTPRIVLLGHSWGGLFASAYTAAHPDRVRSLALIDAEPPDKAADDAGFDAFNTKFEKLVSEGVIKLPLPPVVDDDCTAQLQALTPVYFSDPGFTPPPGSLETTCHESIGDKTNAGLTTGTLSGIAAGLAQYHGPALILSGADDPFGPGWVEASKQELTGTPAQVVVVPDAGHFPWLEQPDLSVPVIKALVHGA